MDLSERRSGAAGSLVDIKAHLEEARLSKNFGEVDKELQAFLQEYGSDPEFAELCDALRPIAERINADWSAAVRDYDERYRDYLGDPEGAAAVINTAGQHLQLEPEDLKILEGKQAPEPPKTVYSEDQVKIWTNLIDGKLDNSSKNDQLTMIHIQELKATLDQSTQLASSLIAGGDKTTNAIINNIA